MIRPLRRRHRRMILALAVMLPALFVAGLLSRPPQPVVPQLLLDAPGERLEVASWSDARWHGAHIRTGRIAGGRERGWVLEPLEDLTGPLLYHVPGDADLPSSGLPDGAVLLGRLAGARVRLRLPPDGAQDATLVLYDLDRQQITAWARLSDEAAS